MFLTPEEIEKKYISESAKLLEFTERRAILVKTLKIAMPSKTKMVQKAISDVDKVIERTEKILELIEKQKAELISLKKNEDELIEMMEKIKPDLLEQIAQHHPEKLAEMEDIFCNEINSDSH